MTRPAPYAVVAPDELAYRRHQQALLAEFGLFALRSQDFDALLQRGTELCAEGMRTPFAKVLEHRPADNSLLVRAGVGWGPNVVGEVTLGGDLESPAGYALQTGSSVISNHLTGESRFRTPTLLRLHGIRRAVNVIIRSQDKGEPYGVLEVDSPSPGMFDDADLAFMQGFANLLGVAIERQHARVAQEQTEAELKSLFQGSPVGNAWTDPAGRILRVNAALCTMTGFAEDELLNMDLGDLAYPEDREANLAKFTELVAGTIPVLDTEKRYLRKDGSILWTREHVTIMHDAARHPARVSIVVRDLSLRKAAQEALSESEEQARLVIEGTEDYAICRVDLQGRIATWNTGAEGIFGWSSEEIIGQDMALLFTPEDRAADIPQQEMQTAREQGFAPDERWHLRKDGSRFWIDGSTRPLHDATGRLRGYIKIGRDDTRRRQTQQALQASEARYRAIIDTAVDAIVLINAEGIVQSFNPAAERIFGYAAGEVTGQNVAMLMTGRDRDAHNGYIDAYRRTGQAKIIGHGREVIGRRKDGSEFPLDLSIAEWQAEGKIFFTGIMRDVSLRKQAEEANARLAAIVSSSGEAIVSSSVDDGHVLTWNRGAERLFGYTEAEAVGKPVNLLLPSDEGEGPSRIFARAMAGERVELDTVRVHKSGERIDVSITATQVRAPDGRVLGVSVVYHDIRERKRAEALMLEALTYQETLTKEVSHRVKNSLALVASLLGIQARGAEDEHVRDALRDAEARVGTIAEVHDQLWRRGDATSVDLADFLGGLCAKLGDTAPHHRFLFEAEAEVTMPTDRAIALGLLLNELVTNAIKYAYPEASGEIRVTFAHNEEGWIRLEVADQGVGLPAGFDLMRPSGSLGSRLIAGFVRQLGGHLDVRSTHPGARFVVEVPGPTAQTWRPD